MTNDEIAARVARAKELNEKAVGICLPVQLVSHADKYTECEACEPSRLAAQLAADVEALRAENANLREDAARLDWLFGWLKGVDYFRLVHPFGGDPVEFREGIDAARVKGHRNYVRGVR